MEKLILIICTLLTLMALALLLPIWGEAKDPQLLIGDAFQRPGLAWGSNSEYAIGDTAVGIIFVESDGTIDTETEDWTTEEKNAAMAEIEAALTWWTVREPRANLTFATEHTQTNTSYEPITRSANDYYLWMPEVLAAMGYSGTSPFTFTDDYNNDLISRFGTDWAFTIFVVDSSADADGKFLNSDLFAFAFRGGPFLIMTYDNGSNTIANMDRVTAHEVGHIFGAMDQLYSACEATAGYLNIPNHNSNTCPWRTYPSIMKFASSAYPAGQVDRYARGQVGWWDANCNGILDPVDENLETNHCLYLHLPIIMLNFRDCS